MIECKESVEEVWSKKKKHTSLPYLGVDFGKITLMHIYFVVLFLLDSFLHNF